MNKFRYLGLWAFCKFLEIESTVTRTPTQPNFFVDVLEFVFWKFLLAIFGELAFA